MGKDDPCCESCELYGDAPAYEEPAQVTPIRAPFETMKVVVTRGGKPYAEVLPDKPQINVGRTSGNEVQLENGTISRRQMVIAFEPHGVTVADLKSSCGTYIDGRMISKRTILPEGAMISCGNFELKIIPR